MKIDFKLFKKKMSIRRRRRKKDLMIITKDQDQIDEVQEDRRWEKIKMKIDSGAIDTCIPPYSGKEVKTPRVTDVQSEGELSSSE